MKSKDIWWFYQDSQGTWRWKRSTFVGKLIGYSQAYPSKADCVANAKIAGYSG
ncbi:MAG: DUF1508 domain-containing protein [Negativicutes bacterium]|nr:DUF1508 domain-containing protein [Negativicutes bacterium]